MLVSIITPTKNSARYVEACIQSVLNQSTHEHIFMDGGSTDGTLNIIQRYQQEYPDRIRLLVSPDKSAGEAWVKGMKLAKGDIFGWLGADDALTPNSLATVSEYFKKNPMSHFIFGGVNYIDESGNVIKTPHIKGFDYQDAVNNYCSIPCTSAFYRKEVVDSVKPDVIAKNDGELEWWLQVGLRFKIQRIDPVLSNFRVYSSKPRKDGIYEYANTVYQINRRYGMSPLSKCAMRYYAANLMRPFGFVLDPVFDYLIHRSARVTNGQKL